MGYEEVSYSNDLTMRAYERCRALEAEIADLKRQFAAVVEFLEVGLKRVDQKVEPEHYTVVTKR